MKKWMRQNLALIGIAAIPVNEFASGSYLQKSFDLLKRKEKLPATADWTRVQGSVQSQLVREINAEQKKYRTRTFDYEGN